MAQMVDSITTVAVFGLDNVLVNLNGQESISNLPPNPTTRALLRNSVGNKNTVTVVISNQDSSKHTETWMWLLKNFKLVHGPTPTYLFMRIGSMPTVMSAIQNLTTILSKYPACIRMECLDTDESLLSSYRDLAKTRNIRFWRMQKFTAGSIISFDSSFVDNG